MGTTIKYRWHSEYQAQENVRLISERYGQKNILVTDNSRDNIRPMWVCIKYGSNGRQVGRVSGLTDDGFEVEAMNLHESEVEELPGKEFGEGYLMWQCTEYGETGELDRELPEVCPNCSAPRGAITAVQED